MSDPKTLAQEKFADPKTLASGIDIIGRCATDPEQIVAGLVRAIRERMGPGSRIIELGFGSGWLLDVLRTELAEARLYGLDLSLGQVRAAAERFGDRGAFAAGDMERLPFADHSFDVIASCWTLYFMRDIGAALDEFVRCLTPTGRLVVGASAPDHEVEANDLVLAAARETLDHEPNEHDIGRRFDLETGLPYLVQRFAQVEVRRWPGKMVLADITDVMALWPKWEPAGLDLDENARVRAAFERLAQQQIERNGALEVRRRDGAFVCDLQP